MASQTQKPSKKPVQQSRVWPIECPVILVTGPIFSGKTMFGISIDENTLDYDFERSAVTYHSDPLTTFDFVDVPVEMESRYPDGHKPFQLWKWFKSDVKERSSSKKYRVIFLDNASPLEDALEAYVVAHPTEFNLSSKQLQYAPSLKWGAMKSAWAQVLAHLSAKCECLVISMHLRSVFDKANNKPSKKKEPKGKETIMQLASLALWFDRPLIDGVPQRKPNAKVIKDRLSVFKRIDGELVPLAVLPPNIKECTPNKIRAYMKSPFGTHAKVLDEERTAAEKPLTEEERIELETEAALAKADAARAEGELIDKKARLAKKKKTSPVLARTVKEILALKKDLEEDAVIDDKKWKGILKMFKTKTVKSLGHVARNELYNHIYSLKPPF